tara:strand:+ start:47407 stop:47676 length:270 start_codon:yes stop_codon:yes gene_type:complete
VLLRLKAQLAKLDLLIVYYSSQKRHFPPHTVNPSAELELGCFTIENARPVSVFDDSTRFQFLSQQDDWPFPVHFILAKTEIRPVSWPIY